MDLQPYLAEIGDIHGEELLTQWRWLLGDTKFDVFRVTSMGDLILRNAAGHFQMLDMIDGKLHSLAETETETVAMLADRNHRKRLLFTFVVRELRESGVSLGSGECYSPELPPILGGELSSDNLRPCDIRIHSSIMGQIHRQVSNLPPGTKIDDIYIEGIGD